jgi:hypothetical protein
MGDAAHDYEPVKADVTAEAIAGVHFAAYRDRAVLLLDLPDVAKLRRTWVAKQFRDLPLCLSLLAVAASERRQDSQY